MITPEYALCTSARGLHHGRRGAGRPVLFVHGWCLDRTLWTYQEEALLGEADVITVDLPGFGGSAGLAGPYDLERHAAELHALIGELQIEPPLVVGFAFGAAVAMTLAAAEPDAVTGLVLIGTPSAATASYPKMPRAMRKDWPLFAERSARAICARPQSDATLAALGRTFGSTPLPVALATVEVLGAFEPLPLAAEVRVPAVYLHGEQDAVVPLRVSAECAAASPKGELVAVPDCGHLVVLDQPDAVTATVRAAL